MLSCHAAMPHGRVCIIDMLGRVQVTTAEVSCQTRCQFLELGRVPTPSQEPSKTLELVELTRQVELAVNTSWNLFSEFR